MRIAESELERLEELLAGRSLGDLSQDEQRELEGFQAKDPVEFEAMSTEFDQTLVRTQIALESRSEPMPEDLRSRIEADAERHVVFARPSDALAERNIHSKFGTREAMAWIACALALLLALGLWSSGRDGGTPARSLASLHQSLANLEGITRASWAAGTTPFSDTVEGEILWSNSAQDGVMRFVGMPVNDPTLEQYQLWIIDPGRDDEPIDGGVFDIDSDGVIFVRVDAKLDVVDPQAFAITIEKPGGVVVSTQERLPLLAKVN